jgi:hypothetical protein
VFGARTIFRIKQNTELENRRIVSTIGRSGE